LEIYLCILVFLELQGFSLTSDDCQPSALQHQNARWLGFRKLITPLLECGKYWEAHKIFKLLLDVYKPGEDGLLFEEFRSGLQLEIDTEENQIIARLGITNAYLKWRLQSKSVPSLEELRELGDAVKIVLTADLVKKSRHYEEYKRNLSQLEVLERSLAQSQTKQQQGQTSPLEEMEVTSLYKASQAGNLDLVKDFVDTGADINAATNTGMTPVSEASLAGHVEVLRYLVQQGADVNLANIQGESYGSTLQAASEGGHEKVVQTLLDGGADVNAQGGDDPLGDTAVYIGPPPMMQGQNPKDYFQICQHFNRVYIVQSANLKLMGENSKFIKMLF
jgi:hypothetical protein